MAAFKTLILVINIFSSIGVVCLVLMQQGKGADAGAGFGGSGSAQGVFGSAGNANFLTRMTAVFATIFFASSLALSYVHSSNRNQGIDFSNVQQSTPVAASAPVSTNVAPAASSTAMPQQAAPVASNAALASSVSETVSASASAAAIAPVAASAAASEPKQTASEPAAAKQDSKKAEPAKSKTKADAHKNNASKNKNAKPAGKQEKK